MARQSLPGIILAAGRSRRMGTNKMLLEFRGKPILQHVIDTARASSLAPLILVLGAERGKVRSMVDTAGILVVDNKDYARGYGSSLQAGLDALSNNSCSGAMFLLGDQPLVTVATVNSLVVAFLQEPHRWVAPCYQGQRGNPVITPVSWFDRIYSLTGDIGPRAHLKDSAARLKLVHVDDEGVIFDIDAPGDYKRLQGL